MKEEGWRGESGRTKREFQTEGVGMCKCVFNLFWLFWVFFAVCGLSLVAASSGYSSLWCTGFSLWWLLLLRSTGSRRHGLQ